MSKGSEPFIAAEGAGSQHWDPMWKRLMMESQVKDGFDSDAFNFAHIDATGNAEMVTLDKHEMVNQLGIRYRDLIAISPTLPLPSPAAILIREKAIIANLEATRMIIAAQHCYVLSLPKASDPAVTTLPTLDHPLIKHLTWVLKEGSNGAPSAPALEGLKRDSSSCRECMPFELKALEIALRTCFAVLESEVASLEVRAHEAVDKLLQSIGREVLESVRGEKTQIDRLRVRVERVQQELAEIMEDDMDMQDLYLSRLEAEDNINVSLLYHSSDSEPDSIGTGSEVGSDARSFQEEEESADNKGDLLTRAATSMVGNTVEDEEEALWRADLADNDRSHSRQTHQAQDQGGRRSHGAHGQHLRRRARHARRVEAEERQEREARAGAMPPETSYVPRTQREDREGFDGGHYEGERPVFQEYNPSMLVHPHTVAEAEDLLESYFIRGDSLIHRLGMLDEKVDDVEDLLEIELDHKRNQIFALNLLVSTVSMSFGWFAAIAGLFGMNLWNSRWDDDLWVFLVTMVVLVGGSIFLITATFLYVKRAGLFFIPSV